MCECLEKINVTSKDFEVEASYIYLLTKARKDIRQKEMDIEFLTEDQSILSREITQ